MNAILYERKHLKFFWNNDPAYGYHLELRIWRLSVTLKYHRPVSDVWLGDEDWEEWE